jgi:hypothetical protein
METFRLSMFAFPRNSLATTEARSIAYGLLRRKSSTSYTHDENIRKYDVEEIRDPAA